MNACYFVKSVTLVAREQTRLPRNAVDGPRGRELASQLPEMALILPGDLDTPRVATVATGRALIFVDDDGVVGGVIEALDVAGSAAAT